MYESKIKQLITPKRELWAIFKTDSGFYSNYVDIFGLLENGDILTFSAIGDGLVCAHQDMSNFVTVCDSTNLKNYALTQEVS